MQLKYRKNVTLRYNIHQYQPYIFCSGTASSKYKLDFFKYAALYHFLKFHCLLARAVMQQ